MVMLPDGRVFVPDTASQHYGDRAQLMRDAYRWETRESWRRLEAGS